MEQLVNFVQHLDAQTWLDQEIGLLHHVYAKKNKFMLYFAIKFSLKHFQSNRMYLWFDEKGKKTRVAAPQYIDYVMTFTEKTVSDESIFPTKYANEFPSSFESIARKILRLLFHVIAHLYAAHFREILMLGLHSHLNLTFAHLTALHKYVNPCIYH